MRKSALTLLTIVLGAQLALLSTPTQAACPPWVRRFLNEWSKVHPEGETSVAHSTATADERMAEFRQGLDGPAKAAGEGGEGKVYTNQLDPDRALKVWKPGRVKDMDEGVDYLIAARQQVAANPTLASKLRVVRVYERGPDWIVREYVAESRPLEEAFATDQAARDAVNDLRRTLNANPGSGGQRAVEQIRSMLSPPTISPNLHWDPANQQIVLIDGF